MAQNCLYIGTVLPFRRKSISVILGTVKTLHSSRSGLERLFSIMDFSLLSPLEFFADPKNGDGRNNKPPAMRVRVDCYTKKLPFRVQ